MVLAFTGSTMARALTFQLLCTTLDYDWLTRMRPSSSSVPSSLWSPSSSQPAVPRDFWSGRHQSRTSGSFCCSGSAVALSTWKLRGELGVTPWHNHFYCTILAGERWQISNFYHFVSLEYKPAPPLLWFFTGFLRSSATFPECLLTSVWISPSPRAPSSAGRSCQPPSCWSSARSSPSGSSRGCWPARRRRGRTGLPVRSCIETPAHCSEHCTKNKDKKIIKYKHKNTPKKTNRQKQPTMSINKQTNKQHKKTDTCSMQSKDEILEQGEPASAPLPCQVFWDALRSTHRACCCWPACAEREK